MALLSPADIQQFEDEGYLVVRGAFAREDALAMQADWWDELAETYGILRDDPATWRRILADLKRAKADPGQHAILTPRVRDVIDGLIGQNWAAPKDWGRAIVTFPEPGDWDVPTQLWHWDSEVDMHRDALNGLLVVGFVGTVTTGGGGTLLLCGSHRLLAAVAGRLPEGKPARRREWLYRSEPWLAALAGFGPSPLDRRAVFMTQGAEVEGVPLRVVELTGEPGDMVFCHPAIIHCVSPNRGAWPRMMRIKQALLTREGSRRVRTADQPAGSSRISTVPPAS